MKRSNKYTPGSVKVRLHRQELLEDYCQLCGATVGSTECCRNNKLATIKDNTGSSQRIEFNFPSDCNGHATRK